jgi:thymidine phosphorylase
MSLTMPTMKILQKKLVNVTLTSDEINLLIKTLQPISQSNGKIDTLLTEIKLQTVWRNEKYID